MNHVGKYVPESVDTQREISDYVCAMQNENNLEARVSGASTRRQRRNERAHKMARKGDTITKRCTKTGKVFTGTRDEIAEHFYRDKSQKDGFSPWSKDAERAYNRAYHAGLKAAKVARVKDIDDAKARARFNKAMQGERVVRSKGKDDTAKGKAITTKRRTARKNRASAIRANNSA